MCCLAPLSLCRAGAEMPGMPFRAWPCPKPSRRLLAEVSLAHLLWQEAPAHVLWAKRGRGASLHPLAPCLGMSPRCSGPAPRHSLFPHSACFPVSLQCLFVPSLTARWKSSYHRQRERNILQVCNSLKHWTWFNMSLLSGRKEGRRSDCGQQQHSCGIWEHFYGLKFCFPGVVLRDSSTRNRSNALLLAWFRLVSFRVLTVGFKRVISTMPY